MSGCLACFSLRCSACGRWVLYIFLQPRFRSTGGHLPVSVDNMTLLIVAAYVLSAIFITVIARRSVIIARVVIAVTLFSMPLLYLPLPAEWLAGLVYFQAFCCVFLIGYEHVLAINLFTLKSGIMYMLAQALALGTLVAVLQNDWVEIPFPVFNGFSILALTLLMFFFCKMPSSIWPQYMRKSDSVAKPKRLFFSVYLLVTTGCFMTLFGTAVAESIEHGVMVYYISFAGFGAVVFFLWKKFGHSPLRSAKILLGVSSLGYVLVIASVYIPALALPTCVLLGAGLTTLMLNPFFGMVLASRYPSRFISATIILIAMATVVIHSAILEAFRNNSPVLYTVYLAFAVVLTVLYLLLEPYLSYSLRKGEEKPAEAPAIDAEEPAPPAYSGAIAKLSRQELRLAELIMQGYMNSELASILNISENTVRSYRKNLYSKLGVHSKPELFRVFKEAETEK